MGRETRAACLNSSKDKDKDRMTQGACLNSSLIEMNALLRSSNNQHRLGPILSNDQVGNCSNFEFPLEPPFFCSWQLLRQKWLQQRRGACLATLAMTDCPAIYQQAFANKMLQLFRKTRRGQCNRTSGSWLLSLNLAKKRMSSTPKAAWSRREIDCRDKLTLWKQKFPKLRRRTWLWRQTVRLGCQERQLPVQDWLRVAPVLKSTGFFFFFFNSFDWNFLLIWYHWHGRKILGLLPEGEANLARLLGIVEKSQVVIMSRSVVHCLGNIVWIVIVFKNYVVIVLIFWCQFVNVCQICGNELLRIFFLFVTFCETGFSESDELVFVRVLLPDNDCVWR